MKGIVLSEKLKSQISLRYHLKVQLEYGIYNTVWHCVLSYHALLEAKVVVRNDSLKIFFKAFGIREIHILHIFFDLKNLIFLYTWFINSPNLSYLKLKNMNWNNGISCLQKKVKIRSSPTVKDSFSLKSFLTFVRS